MFELCVGLYFLFEGARLLVDYATREAYTMHRDLASGAINVLLGVAICANAVLT